MPPFRPVTRPRIVIEVRPRGIRGRPRVVPLGGGGPDRRFRGRRIGAERPRQGLVRVGVVGEFDREEGAVGAGAVGGAVHDAVARIRRDAHHERPGDGPAAAEGAGEVHLVESLRPDGAELVDGRPHHPRRVRAVVPRGRVPVQVPAGDDADEPAEVRPGHGVQPQRRAQDLVRLELHQCHALGAAVRSQLLLPPERAPLAPLDVGYRPRSSVVRCA